MVSTAGCLGLGQGEGTLFTVSTAGCLGCWGAGRVREPCSHSEYCGEGEGTL